MSLFDKIKSIKPTMKEATLNDYIEKLKRLYYGIRKEGNFDYSLTFLEEYEKVNKHLDDYTKGTRKNYLSAIIAGLTALGKTELLTKYRKVNIKIVNELREIRGKPTQKQKENWITFDQLNNIYKESSKKFEEADFKDKLTFKQQQTLIHHLILSLYLSDCSKLHKAMNPPRRLEYADCQIVNHDFKDDDKGNFLVKNKNNKASHFVLNNYKNFRYYGKQTIKLNPALKRVINIFLKYNPTNTYLFETKLKSKMSKNQLGQKITAIFKKFIKDKKKKISLNMIRTIFSSEVFKNTPSQKELNTYCNLMGNSISVQMEHYRKSIDKNGQLK
jgi:hypothetical protein